MRRLVVALGVLAAVSVLLGASVLGAMAWRAAAAERPSVGQPERVRVPATIVVHRRDAELVRHVLLADPRNRVAALRVCKLGHTDAAHCTLIRVGDVRYGAR